jgi:glucose-1-phosphate adenylyltransferase
MLERHKGDKALILAGDHIYRMDYAAMLQFHEEKGADLTIACMQVPVSEAYAFGVMKIDEDHRILDFKEKPEHPDPLPNDPSTALVSMGIYVFSMSRLIRALNEDHEDPNSSHDFGKDIIPRLVESDRVYAYSFGEDRGRVTPDRYWRDVGTIDAYYEANMDLLEPIPPLNLYQDDWAIRTYHSQNPPARMVPGTHGEDGLLVNSILGSGAIIMGGIVRHAILSSRVRVHTNAIIENAIVFEDVTVGEDVVLRKCIVDKGVKIPAGECIGVDLEHDARRFTVSEKGIVVVPRHYQF